MIRWLMVVFVGLMVINAFTPFVKKLGLGRLPGDLRFTLFGREIFIPLTTTILLCLIAGGLSKLI